MQSFRNALQKKLREETSTAGATVSRFLFGAPMAALYLGLLYTLEAEPQLPTLSNTFLLYIAIAACSQIFATAFMVMLFSEKNYAIGVGLGKSEALIAAVLGALFFSAPLNNKAWLGVIIGCIAVWLMSKPNADDKFSFKVFTLGLASGLCFALCTLYVRESCLLLDLPFMHSAAWVLLWVISLQTVILVIWLLVKEPQTLRQLFKKSRQVFMVSLCGFIASVGWFTAMSLEKVALVKTLGQIEVLFTLLISYFWFKEKLKLNDLWGLCLIIVSAILVVSA